MIGVWRVWRTTIVTAIGAVALLNAPRADAQEKWPSRPVTLVVPVGAGTITDVAGRLLADHLKDIFGQPFVVENKAGAGATLGARYVARAQPDGYTLLVGGNTTHSAVPSLFKSAPYDPVADFTPIARVGLLGQFLCTNSPDEVGGEPCYTGQGDGQHAGIGAGDRDHPGTGFVTAVQAASAARPCVIATNLPACLAGKLVHLLQSQPWAARGNPDILHCFVVSCLHRCTARIACADTRQLMG